MRERGLECPGCGDRMVDINVRGIPIDRCPGCLSLWLDAGELADAARCQVPPLQVRQESERVCPHCGRKLRLAKLGPAVVDWCAPCRGMYLDAGEFEIVRRGRPPLPTQPFDPWQEPSHSILDALVEMKGEEDGLFRIFLPPDED